MANGAEKLRQVFIEGSKPVLEYYLSAATEDVESPGAGTVRLAVWNLLADIIRQAGDLTKFNVHGKDIDAQIKKVLRKVSRGKISPKAAQEYIGLIQAGFNVTEAPDLMAKLEELIKK